MLSGGKRSALLVTLTAEMQRRGSWCGETHIQKAMFFLQELLKVYAGFDFLLYRHGPFSFDLRDELLSMRADGLLELAIKQEGYGPAYTPTAFSEEFLGRYPKTIARYRDQVDFIARELKDKRVTDLEKLATTFFIWSREGKRHPQEIVDRLIELKPHVTQNDAWKAYDEISDLMKKVESLIFAGGADGIAEKAS